MRFGAVSFKKLVANSGQLSHDNYLRHVAFALQLIKQRKDSTKKLFFGAASSLTHSIVEIHSKRRQHKPFSRSAWGFHCRLGGLGGRRRFGIGRHKLKLYGERGRLPMIRRACW